jgi:hypothetical protein
LRCHKDIPACCPHIANEINSLNDATKTETSIKEVKKTLDTGFFLSNFSMPINTKKSGPNKPFS